MDGLKVLLAVSSVEGGSVVPLLVLLGRSRRPVGQSRPVVAGDGDPGGSGDGSVELVGPGVQVTAGKEDS